MAVKGGREGRNEQGKRHADARGHEGNWIDLVANQGGWLAVPFFPLLYPCGGEEGRYCCSCMHGNRSSSSLFSFPRPSSLLVALHSQSDHSFLFTMTLFALASRATTRSFRNPLLKTVRIQPALPIARSFHALIPQQSMNPTFAGALQPYCEQNSTHLPQKFDQLHSNTVANYPTTANKTVSSLQGQLLRLVMRMTRPQRVLELGCFMGYSAMAMADGMSADGVIYTCEKDEKAAQLARELFQQQGYQGTEEAPRRKAKIELMEGNALDSLETMSRNGLQFDAVFLGKFDRNCEVPWPLFLLLTHLSFGRRGQRQLHQLLQFYHGQRAAQAGRIHPRGQCSFLRSGTQLSRRKPR